MHNDKVYKITSLYDVEKNDIVTRYPDIERRIGGTLYSFAEDIQYELYESDIQWIEKNIASHPLFRVVEKTVQTGPNVYEYHCIFYEQFLDMPKIPKRVQKLLAYTLGIYKEYNKRQNHNNVPQNQRFFCELWLERMRAWR